MSDNWGMGTPVGNGNAEDMLRFMRKTWASLEEAGGGMPKEVMIHPAMLNDSIFMDALRTAAKAEGFEIRVLESI